MNFRWDIFFEAFPLLLPFVKVTLFLAITSFTLAFVMSLVLSMIVRYKIPVLSQIANVYISFFRSTPIISQLFFFFFGFTQLIPAFKSMSPTVAIILVLGLNEAAFMAETIRGALSSVDKGQYEASLAVGMTESQAMRRIIIPQAIRVAIPSLGNAFIGMVKGTSLGFTIGVVELMAEAKLLATKNYRIMEAYMAALFIYWVLIVILSQLQKLIEKKLNKAY